MSNFLDETKQFFPAYGRKYDSVKSMKQDWKDGKDFQLEDGRFFSKDDVKIMLLSGIKILYINIKNVSRYVIRNGKIQGGW